MPILSYFLKSLVYILCFVCSFYAMSALQFERWMKPNHTKAMQLLYILCTFALAYLVAEFFLAFAYRI